MSVCDWNGDFYCQINVIDIKKVKKYDAEQVSSLLSKEFKAESLTKLSIIRSNKTYCWTAQSYRGVTLTSANRISALYVIRIQLPVEQQLQLHLQA